MPKTTLCPTTGGGLGVGSGNGGEKLLSVDNIARTKAGAHNDELQASVRRYARLGRVAFALDLF